jgi:hypothetical protein
MRGSCRKQKGEKPTKNVRKYERMRALGRPMCNGGDNIKRDFKEIWCENVDWIQLTQKDK